MENRGHHTDSLFMQRALQLATLGRGHVSPNPLVGSIVVHNNSIIGEGWHKQYGQAHAEVNAIASVADKGLLRESTVYVNLEPCSHVGKTPPCADMLIHHGVKRVVVANVDSNPLVGGTGIKKLREANIEVTTGILETEGHALNRNFFTFIEKNRPYIILKWAQTADGFIARENFDSKWISNSYSRQLVHRWRTEEDALLVGTATTQYDNPRLNVRDWSGRNPVRVVADRLLKLGSGLHVMDGTQKTILYNVIKDSEMPNLLLTRIHEKDFFYNLVENLYRQGIQSVLVEGGKETLNFFITAGLWDEARVFTAEKMFGKGIAAPILPSVCIREEKIMNDRLQWLRPKN